MRVSRVRAYISIHALREEGDDTPQVDVACVMHFYPRPPRGGRRTPACIWLSCSYFYPRPPRGGRPGQHSGAKCDHDISIHALREEGDSNTSYQRAMADIFLSTPSARRATSARLHRGLLLYISIHALREEGDSSCLTACSGSTDFYPRPPRGGRPVRCS